MVKSFKDHHALILTAQNGNDGYVLRYFAPSIGIDEDLATGSAQCSLAPYWLSLLSSTSLKVRQLSSEGGYFQVERKGNEHILLTANTVLAGVATVD
ncbi:PhzF family phenazine biosynthesis protein [Photobacterium sanctipauli]|uniref:PhzF family phenazine biosynthesis protein n=1 Tax=Photobacterium sanctipauli TaxID=1342794 RepID=A0A2T3NN84_9GAMM|nr:PhzF family phenazine biosynthesis protein [Photobacterium sanctipauli]